MKKFLSIITAAAVLLGSTIAYASASEPLDEPTVEAYADTVEVEDQAALLRYRENDDGTLTVYAPEYTPDKLTNVVIPSEKDGKKVTRIGGFRSCRNLTSVTIPDSVTSIAWQAFEYCASLTSVEIPDSVTSIGNMAFYRCTSLTSITIPDSVTSMGSGVFSNCTSLTSVTIPDGVTRIDDDTFSGCASLTSITIPDSVTTIGNRAFMDCTSLTEISLPKTVISLERNYITDRPVYDTSVFHGCTSLKNINVAEGNPVYFSLDGVLYAKNQKYNEAHNTNKDILVWYPHGKEEGRYTIPENVMSIADGAIRNRPKLENIYVDPNNDIFKSIDGVLFNIRGNKLELYPSGRKQTHYTIPDDVNRIEEDAFYGCTNLVSVTFPDGIGGAAFFRDCTRLKTITLPNGVTKADFSGCTKLESINLPESLTSIDFEDCISLKSEMVIPESVTELGMDCFNNCKSLTSVVIPDSVTRIGNYAFQDCEKLTTVKMSKNIDEIGWSAFWNCRSLSSIKIPNSVTDIAYGTFSSCTSLKSINLPQNVKSIDGSAFQYCTGIKSVRIPESVESLGRYAFYNCENLETVTILGNITEIDYWTFYRCINLKTVVIPNSVTCIYSDAFLDCENLKDVYFAGTEEQWAEVRGSNNAPLKNATIHYNSTGPDIVELPVEIDISKPSEGAPATENLSAAAQNASGEVFDLPIDKNGNLDISNLDGGDYSFTFSADHCAPRSYSVSISSGTVTGLEDGVELRLYGDIDDKGDGIVDIRDVARANKYFKTGEGLSGYLLTVSDINGDGVIDIRDVAQMNAHFKGTGNLWDE